MSLPRSALHVGIDASRAQVAQATGTEHYARSLILSMLNSPGPHEYSIYVRGQRTGEFAGPRSREKLVRPGRLWTHVGLSREMLRHSPDALFVPAHVLPIMRPARTVVTVHDLGYLYFPYSHKRLSWWYLHVSTAFHCKVATRLIADSHATKVDLIRHYGVDPARVSVIHLGVDPDFRPGSAADRRMAAERFAGGRNYLLFVGTVQPRKNILGLLAAYADLRRRIDQPPELVITGKLGWGGEQVLQQAGERGLLNGVRIIEYVPRGELPKLYAGAMALVLPSFYEGFGLPAAEAMASGIPVVASNSSALPEVVGDAGLLVDPSDVAAIADGVERIVGDKDLREALGAKGVQMASGFTWERCAAATLSVIEQACGYMP